jgi:hypothetical protein
MIKIVKAAVPPPIPSLLKKERGDTKFNLFNYSLSLIQLERGNKRGE